VVVLGAGECLGKAQPHEPVIRAIGDRLRQILDRLGITLGAVFGIGVAAQPRNQRRLLPGGGNAVDQLRPIGGGGFRQLARAVLLRRRGSRDKHQ